MFISITEIDAKTGILCTEQPMTTGPAFPVIKGLSIQWVDQSHWPIQCSSTGVYMTAPKYYCTCDDDADLNVVGILSTHTEEEFNSLKYAEFYARSHPASWVFNQTSLQWDSPTQKPTDGKNYLWNETLTAWVEFA